MVSAAGYLPDGLQALVQGFLAEDVGRGDVTTEAVIAPSRRGEAWIESRERAVIAGLDIALECFRIAGPQSTEASATVREGPRVDPGERVATISGDLRAVLTAERTALNLLGRLSGIATLTSRFVAAVAGTPSRIVDTRKTTPGMRRLEKYAVRVGGGSNHRFGLDDGILIKDNHIAAAGGLSKAIAAARDSGRFGLAIEVEVSDLDELDEALAAGADAVLLDNMSPEMAAEAVRRVGGKLLLEASGGINLDNVRAFACSGVDVISVGALTHSASSVDFSLEVGRVWD